MLTLMRLRHPLSRAVARNARNVLANPTATSLADLFIGSSCEDFIFSEALKMSETEFLVGATMAAQAVNEAMRASRKGDDAALDALERNGALEPALRSALSGELNSGPIVQESASLTSTRLIVGAQRSSYRAGCQNHQLTVGSQLVICDTAPADPNSRGYLWHPDRQIALMVEEGLSVQLTVVFGNAATGNGCTTMTFEAALDAEDVMRASAGYDQPEHRQDEISFSVADVNGVMPDGNAFWAPMPSEEEKESSRSTTR